MSAAAAVKPATTGRDKKFNGANGSGNEDRVHGDGTHRKMSRGPQHGVENQRSNGCVQPVNRRKPGKEGVTHRLRHQHHCGRQTSDEVGAKVGALIVAQPAKDREHGTGEAPWRRSRFTGTHPSIMAAACASAGPPVRFSRILVKNWYAPTPTSIAAPNVNASCDPAPTEVNAGPGQ
ncbi:MAG: hypothetical protein JRH14_21880 [Deltaproteobacteria bacterium]|nr:hypothetical protein [Deltaproteobacteria bacterium]